MTVAKPPERAQHEEALIKEARERQLRRRLLGAACVAIAAAAGLSIHALASGGYHRAPSASAPAVPAPPCRPSQLSASFGPSGAAGLALGGLEIANRAGRPCALPVGRPTVQVVFRGKTLSTTERSWGSDQQFGPRAGRILRPGHRAYFEIGWRSWCPNPAAAPEGNRATLLLRFHGGLRLTVPETSPERTVSLPGCGEAVHPAPWIAVSRLLRYR